MSNGYMHIHSPSATKVIDWSAKHPIKGVVLTNNCCNRFVKPKEAEVKISFYEWYDPLIDGRCKEGYGCKVNKNYLRTAHLREHFRYAED